MRNRHRPRAAAAARAGLAWPLAATAGILIAGLCGWVLGAHFGGHRARPRMPVLGRAPTYTLENQLGQRVDSKQFDGKVQVVTFLFPYCTTYCPLIAAHLVGFERLLADSGLAGRVQIVAFNVDPAQAGPGQMRAFLHEYGWNPRDLHWQYLTGKPEVIRKVVTGGFHIAYRRTPLESDDGADAAGSAHTLQTPQPTVANPLADEVKPGYDITHNDGLELVDAQGRIRRIHDQADVVSNQELLREVKGLLGPRAG